MPPSFPEPRSLFVQAGSQRLHVATWGDPANPPLLLLHGMRDHARSWDWIANALADRHYVVAPDLRGHGDSDWTGAGSYIVPAFVLDLADMVAALGLTRFAIVGHSFGGAIGLRYAGAFPNAVSAFCGIECVELPIVRKQRSAPQVYPSRLQDWIAGARALRDRSARSYPSLADAQRLAEAHPALDAETIGHLARHSLVVDAYGGLRWKYDNATRLRPPDDADGKDIDEVLAAISCPVLLAYGGKSWIPLPPAERLAKLRDHRVAHFPSASHWLHHQVRADFLGALMAFLPTHAESPVHA